MNPSLTFILPELIILAGAVIVLTAGVFGVRRHTVGILAFTTVMLGMLWLPGTLGAGHTFFNGMLVNDTFGFTMNFLLLFLTTLIILMSIGYAWPADHDTGEYYFFLITAAAAMMLAVSSGNLMMIYLAVETLSIISYILASYLKKDLYSTEAGLKYFLFGALSTGLMLYGISLIYGLFGTLDLGAIGTSLATTHPHDLTLILAAVLVFAGLAFKASLAPFHIWVADVYDGAPWPVAAFFSIAPKALGFALIVKIFFIYPYFIASSWTMIGVFLAMITMSIGNLSAFHQTSVKRLLAFSSVAQAGYMLAGLSTGIIGLPATFYYIIVYAFMNLGAFVCAASLSTERAPLDSFKGLARRSPAAAFIFSVFLLSLAGLPPLAGFLAKFMVIVAIMNTQHYILSAIFMINSVIAFFYYLKIIRTMYFDEPCNTALVPTPLFAALIQAICLTAVIILGIWPQFMLNVMSKIFS
jgi:NADH-quinone oxidoreductase subunit N